MKSIKVYRSERSGQNTIDNQPQEKTAQYVTRNPQQLSSQPLVSPVRPSASRPQDFRSPAPSLFRYESEYWTITYDGTVLRLKDTTGLCYLAQLLRCPEQGFHVLDLVHIVTKAAEETHVYPSSQGEVQLLDFRAKATYQRRLEELRKELVEAEEFNDTGRAERLREEVETLTQEFANAVGLGGSNRKTASTAERARVNVTRAIKAVIKKIAEQSPSLALYLSTTIKTGTFCSYTPDPRIPVNWEF